MAARENQGLLIAVIILVLLTLVLALAAFLGLSKASENADSNAQFKADIAHNKKLAEGYQNQAQILMALAGDLGGPDVAGVEGLLANLDRLASGSAGNEQTTLQGIAEESDTIFKAYQKDMAGTAPAGGEASWRQLNRDLQTLLAKKNSDFHIQVKTSKRTNLDAETKIAAMQKTLAAMQASLTKLQGDLAAEKKRGLEKEAELKDELAQAVEGNDKVNKAYAAFRQVSDENLQAAKNTENALVAENASLKAKVNRLTRENFDNADGKILDVASGQRTVYIDLGSDHGLTNNQTFAVYDKEITNFEKGRHKAMIEVTKVFPFRAQARITEENRVAPILSGDHVLTATWDPGHSVPFALAGVFDLDGDIYDDTEKLISMIKRNGGDVVAWHDQDGVVTGKIDSSVRFLVVGDSPVSGAESLRPEAARSIVIAMQQMQEDAKANTVDMIDLQKLLNRMGVRARPKTVHFQKRSSGFRTRQPSDGSGTTGGSGTTNGSGTTEGSGTTNGSSTTGGSDTRSEGSSTR